MVLINGAPTSDSDDQENNVYLTLSLSKYPFLKSKKIGDTGSAIFKGEIESSSKDGHEIIFNDILNKKAEVRV